jgi:amidase
VINDDDAEDYLFLLNSLDATLDQVAALPEYIEPRLLPDESTLPRSYLKAKENPQNAWSHQVRNVSSGAFT